MDKPMGVPIEQLPFHLRGESPMPELEEDIGWGDSLSASWTTEAPAGAIWSQATDRMPEATPKEISNFDLGLFDSVTYIQEKYPELDDELLHQYYTGLKSPAQADWKARNLGEEIEARRIQAKAPFMQQLLTDTGVSIFASPTTVAEGAAAVLTRHPILQGLNMATRGARRAAQFGGLAVAGTAIDEFILQTDQDMRSKGETVATLVGAGVLGSAFGWATGREVVRLNPDLSAKLPESDIPMSADTGAKPGGAAARLDDISQDDYNAIMNDPELSDAEKLIKVEEKKGENYEVVGGLANIGKGAAKLAAFFRISPETTLAVSNSPVMRRFNAFMTNSPLTLKGQEAGEGYKNLDAVARRGDTKIEVGVTRIYNDSYTAYKKATPKDQRISQGEFNLEIQRSVARGHISDNEFALQAGRALDETFLTPIGQRGVRGQYLKGDDAGNPVAPLGDKKWFLRAYSRSFAARMTPDQYADGLVEPYMKRLRQNAAQERAEIDTKIAKLREDMKAKGEKPDPKVIRKLQRSNKYGKELKKLEADDTEIRDRFRQMRDNIAKGGDAMQNAEYSGFGIKIEADGTWKMSDARTLDIATEDMPADYLEPDSMMTLINSLKRTNRQLLVTEDPRFGDVNFQNWITAREKEHDARIELAKGDEKKTKKLENEWRRDEKYIKQLGQSYYGVRPDSPSEWATTWLSNLKAVNALAGLGSVLFSTIPELGAALSHNGVRGYVQLSTAWLSDPKGMRAMTNIQKEWMDIGIQTSLGMRLAEKGEYAAGMGRASRTLHKASDTAVDKVYMLGSWTRTISAEAAAMTQFKLSHLMGKKTLSKTDLADLGRLGISKDSHDAIREQIAKHGEDLSSNARNPHVELWDDDALRQDVINAINAEVDNIIIRPGVGATPFLGRTLAGSVALQFKQFLLAATSKYLVADIQRAAMGDWRAIERQLAFLALGYTSVSLKNDYLYGETAKKRWAEKDFADRLIDGLAHGGGAGLASDAVNLQRELMFPGTGSSRFYGQRSWQSMIGGPSYSKVFEDIPIAYGLAGKALGSGQEFTKQDAKTLWRNAPGASFWPIRMGFSITTGKGGHEAIYEAIE